jgi:sugar O-acyltransferase (sialic acid O-acetyltransferase NeuD family)
VVLELLAASGDLEVVGLIDDLPENGERRLDGLEVLGGSVDLLHLAREHGFESVLIGFGAAQGRAAAVAAVEAAGLALPALVHPSAQVAPSATLAAGIQLLPNACIGPGAQIGRCCLVNTGAVIEHDVALGDCSVVDPGAVLAGRVRVGSEVEVGSGAVIIPDVEVGDGAVVGAGAVVVRAVADGQTVVGVPARPLARG